MRLTLIEIFALLIFPVMLFIFGFVPLNLRSTLLIVVVLVAIGLTIIEKIPLKDLGFRIDNLQKSFTPYLLFTLIGSMCLITLGIFLEKQPLQNWWTYSHLQWAFLPISALQEFGYRAFFQTKLQKYLPPFLAIFIITILYSGMHIIWKDPLIILMTFVAGMSWGYLWYKYPNFYLLVLSHSILNFLAIYLGFFPWLITEYF